jgi:hypothetical protein
VQVGSSPQLPENWELGAEARYLFFAAFFFAAFFFAAFFAIRNPPLHLDWIFE